MKPRAKALPGRATQGMHVNVCHFWFLQAPTVTTDYDSNYMLLCFTTVTRDDYRVVNVTTGYYLLYDPDNLLIPSSPPSLQHEFSPTAVLSLSLTDRSFSFLGHISAVFSWLGLQLCLFPSWQAIRGLPCGTA